MVVIYYLILSDLFVHTIFFSFVIISPKKKKKKAVNYSKLFCTTISKILLKKITQQKEEY